MGYFSNPCQQIRNREVFADNLVTEIKQEGASFKMFNFAQGQGWQKF